MPWVEATFFRDLGQACPIRVRAIPADNGKESANRLFGSRGRGASGEHRFDRLCGAPGIERRPARPGSPQANGAAARPWGRTKEMPQGRHCGAGGEPGAMPRRYVLPCNQEPPRPTLEDGTPLRATEG